MAPRGGWLTSFRRGTTDGTLRSMSDAVDRRCPSCHALVALDAGWCGQCFTPLAAPDVDPTPASDPSPSEAASGAVSRPTSATRPDQSAVASEAFWPCPICQSRNPIAADTCQVCGTPFAEVMRGEPERPHVTPREALTRSLIFPGLGHRAVGRTTDGFVRGVLFGLSLSIAVLAGLGGVGSVALLAIVVVNLLTAIAVYVLSALESWRLAGGGDLLVPSRTLLWILVGEVFLSMGIVGFAVVTTNRG